VAVVRRFVAIDAKLIKQFREFDAIRCLVEHDPHGVVFIVGANQNHRLTEAGVFDRRRCDEESSGEGTLHANGLPSIRVLHPDDATCWLQARVWSDDKAAEARREMADDGSNRDLAEGFPCGIRHEPRNALDRIQTPHRNSGRLIGRPAEETGQ
jgi:hypothetical protein